MQNKEITEITKVPFSSSKWQWFPQFQAIFLLNCRISRKLRAADKRTTRVWTNRVRAECCVVRERTNQRRLCGVDGKSAFGSCWPPGRVELLLLLFSATKKQSLRRRKTHVASLEYRCCHRRRGREEAPALLLLFLLLLLWKIIRNKSVVRRWISAL